MGILNEFFLGTFFIFYSVLYPLFKRPIFATYVVIFLIFCFFVVKMYRYLRSMSIYSGSIKDRLKVALLWGVEVYMVSFLLWYLFVHFKTYKLMS